MKTIAIGSFFVLFALAAGLVATTTPAAFADHSEVVVEPVPGSGTSGCQDEGGCYNPMVATVDVGGVVIFSNTDNAVHVFTAGTMENAQSEIFDSGLVNPGSSFEYTADTVGEIPHFCMVHPWMTGLIVVQDAGSTSGSNGDDMKEMNGDDMKDGHDGEKTEMRDKEPSATGMLSDGTTVAVWSSKPAAGEQMKVYIKFKGQEHVNYDIMATQNGNEVLSDMDAHEHEGKGEHMTAPLESEDPVDITVTFKGYGIDEKTGPIGDEVMFANIVPEFGTIAMMVLAVAIISIIAVTAKSRVIPRL